MARFAAAPPPERQAPLNSVLGGMMKSTVFLAWFFPTIAICQSSLCDDFENHVRHGINLPAPTNYENVCGSKNPLCTYLTAGYPRSTPTIAYFVPSEELRTLKRQGFQGFSSYIVVQATNRRSPEEFRSLKNDLTLRNGNIPDNSEIPANLELQGKSQLGVFFESKKSISFGIVQSFTGPNGNVLSQVAINTLHNHDQTTISTYLFSDYKDEDSVEQAKHKATAWLACLETSN